MLTFVVATSQGMLLASSQRLTMLPIAAAAAVVASVAL